MLILENDVRCTRQTHFHSFTPTWSIYIEIDNSLVTNNGGMIGAINYVNAIVTAASAIYEREIDTHCECGLYINAFYSTIPRGISFFLHVY